VKVGIGLPNTVGGTPGRLLVDWARRAEERGFAGLATIDRLAYHNHDSLTALAVAGAVTERIGLFTNILLAPVYAPVQLAKAAATIDQVTGGRLTLGLAPGGREDDYQVVGRDFQGRGRAFDAGLEELHAIWRGSPRHSPTPTSGDAVPIMIGGASEAALRRTVRWGAGWTSGGAPPEQAAAFAARVREAWSRAGREGQPRLAALTYFSLGDESASRGYLKDYYGFLGPYADMIADGALRSPEAIKGALAAYADGGIEEVYLDPTVADLAEVDRLADVVF
jgi:alkanesulfonate monooxygenase SsuD/methylene tetrahydromethanopterin reductase-like flavin-dependent oxidoreductase (luciferase family)